MALSPGRRGLAVSLGLALTASLAVLPGAAFAQDARTTDSARQAAAAEDGPRLSYVVNTERRAHSVSRVQRAVSEAGGSVVTAYRKIGVIVAHSSNPDFAEEMRAVRGVVSAGATRTAPLRAAETTQEGAPRYLDGDRAGSTASPAAAQEPLEPLQWNLPAIKADRAHRIGDGSRRVTVAVIDTGVDDTHPDLQENFSRRQSANCVGGKADTTLGAWRPYTSGDYHGTHVAGIVAAARNGVGVAGTAPGVRVASIKVSEPDTSLFYTEAVVCAFMFAAEHGVEVTNSSYYVDPWLYTCRDDADQGALLEAVGRAVSYAERRGTVNVASAGNAADDLAADELLDVGSPNDSRPYPRRIDPTVCLDMPTQLPGVLTVSATGSHTLKSYYSNYGQGVIDVAAPGGDVFQVPQAPAESGGVLSTMPDGEYAYLQGTSMAGPHVAGVAALIKSRHPWASPRRIAWRLQAQADNPGCPDEPYDPDGDGVANAECTGGAHLNSFYGHGIVDALDAVRR